MKASRITSAVLALLALGMVIVSAAFVVEAVPRIQSGYVWAVLGAGVIVAACALTAIVLTVRLAAISPAALTTSPRVPRLLSALVITLGILTVTMLGIAAFMLWGSGWTQATGRLVTVWLCSGALVSAAMMMIATGFRSLLGKYRTASDELATVI